jgi:phage terminase large subunit GpA-like protein
MVEVEFAKQLIDIISAGSVSISNIKPSEWTEENVIMGKPFPGSYRYSLTPYWREVIDRFAQDDPMKWLAIMKGAQIGFSAGVLIPVILWMIKNDPSNTYFLVGSPNLIEKATEKLDIGIDNAGLRNYIKPQVNRKRNQKTGDTNNKKEFIGGYVHIGSANNHEDIRDVSLKYGLFDDFESVKSKSKKSGDTRSLLEQRFSAYEYSHKICYGSTPELDETSNILPAYLLGDQRKFLIPCPCCGEFIELKWKIENEGITGGITWKVDENNRVVKGSVGYICQMCGQEFDDKNKQELLNAGFWKPTAEPSQPGYYSYHISSLYAPVGMYGWEHYVNKYIECHPPGQPRKEDLWKTFVNVVLGETYKTTGSENNANELQKNCRNYEIGIIPERVSERDGNGKIVLLTCAADLNGKEDDARLDYEIVGWSENGSSYSIQHGSIGTFVPRENTQRYAEDRERWTYNHGKPNSVWKKFDEVLETRFKVDNGTRQMKVFFTGIDVGHCKEQALQYIDNTNFTVCALKGDKDKIINVALDAPNFKKSRERGNMYILEVNKIKDKLSDLIRLKWNPSTDEVQPPGYMNYPTPSNGLYLYQNYFEHFEAEHRILDTKEGKSMFVWKKKNTAVQNHMWDCRVYNYALKEIFTMIICENLKIKNYEWIDAVDVILGRK